jgi:hypothetical protein
MDSDDEKHKKDRLVGMLIYKYLIDHNGNYGNPSPGYIYPYNFSDGWNVTKSFLQFLKKPQYADWFENELIKKFTILLIFKEAGKHVEFLFKVVGISDEKKQDKLLKALYYKTEGCKCEEGTCAKFHKIKKTSVFYEPDVDLKLKTSWENAAELFNIDANIGNIGYCRDFLKKRWVHYNQTGPQIALVCSDKILSVSKCFIEYSDVLKKCLNGFVEAKTGKIEVKNFGSVHVAAVYEFYLNEKYEFYKTQKQTYDFCKMYGFRDFLSNYYTWFSNKSWSNMTFKQIRSFLLLDDEDMVCNNSFITTLQCAGKTVIEIFTDEKNTVEMAMSKVMMMYEDKQVEWQTCQNLFRHGYEKHFVGVKMKLGDIIKLRSRLRSNFVVRQMIFNGYTSDAHFDLARESMSNQSYFRIMETLCESGQKITWELVEKLFCCYQLD